MFGAARTRTILGGDVKPRILNGLRLARGPGGKTLKETAAWAGMCGIAEITAPSLSDRLHGSVAFFSALTTHLLAAGRPPTPAVWRGRCLHLCDASSLSERGGTGTDWRI